MRTSWDTAIKIKILFRVVCDKLCDCSVVKRSGNEFVRLLGKLVKNDKIQNLTGSAKIKFIKHNVNITCRKPIHRALNLHHG